MNTHEFLSYLKSLDIKLSLNGERLTCNAPKGALTVQLQAEIAERKAEILEFLQKNTGLDLRPVKRDGNLPLSFAQQRMWILQQLEPESSAYHIHQTLRLRGSLNFKALQQALACIVERHEPLRTTFVTIDGEPVQVIRSSPNFDLPLIDLSSQEPEQQNLMLQSKLQQGVLRTFDLTSALMLRATLIRLSDREHVLQIVMHHIISDGWSMSVFMRELSTLYQTFSAEQPNPLPELLIQYADFAHWQRQWLSGEVLDQQLEYWKKQLSGAAPLLELPTDYPRPPQQSYRGAFFSFTLSQTLTESLKRLSREADSTLFMTLLAAFNTLLYRYTKQEDVILGVPIANRNYEEIQELIGFFANTLALRTDLSGNPSFLNLLERVRQVALGAYAHQDLPFEKLVEELQPERSLSYNPLFQVMFALQNVPTVEQQLEKLSIEPVQIQSTTSMFDLSLVMTETPDGLRGELEYSTDLFKIDTIERMIAHWQILLEAIVANPSEPIAQLPLLTPAEREQLLVKWNQTETDYPRDKCIHQLFEEQVERTPDAVALVWKDQQLTYRELNTRANQLAHYLQQLGVKPEVLVGICLERSVEMIVALLAILKAGGAYVPLDPAYPAERLAYMVDDAAIAVLLTQNKWTSQLPQHQAQVICLDSDWEKIALESQENSPQNNTGENLAYVIYTSGSTGLPKGVMISHQALSCFTQTAIAEYKLTPSDRVLQFASINFDAAVEEIYPCLCTGATLVLRTDEMLSNSVTFFQTCATWQLTVLDLPTAYWHQLTAQLANTNIALPESLRLVIIGGEKVLAEPVKMWQEYVVKSGKSDSLELINTYGPTETTVSATLYRILYPSNDNREVPIGRPLAHLQTYILDSHLQPVPIGVPGELHIGGESLARGYLNRAELTTEKFIQDPFGKSDKLYKTGDKVRYLPDGNIEFLGRIDNQVKIRGFRIELGEIETLLAQHPGIRETVVIVREELPGDKRLVAYVVGNPQLHSSQLRSFVQERLPHYMVPSAFVLLDTMPLTPNGKIDLRALATPDASTIVETEFAAPTNPTEEVLATIWAEVLGVEQVGIHDNFFELGGHSLLATKVISQLNQVFSVELSLLHIFETPTVAGLTVTITQSKFEQIEDKEIDRLLAELEELSDEEVQQLLVQEMQSSMHS